MYVQDQGPATMLLVPDTHPTTRPLGPDGAPAWVDRTRDERTLVLLRQTRQVLAETLQELSRRHPDDRALSARVVEWHLRGGVRFPA